MAADDAGLDDVVAWRARRDARRLADFAGPNPGIEHDGAFDALDERLRDAVRSTRVADARACAERAAPGPSGERDRARLRLLVDPFLVLAASDSALELARALRERQPSGGMRERILCCADPDDRRRLQRDWERVEEAIAPRRRAHREVLDAAARSVGASSCSELVALTAPIPPAATVAAVERDAIAPLDGAVAVAAAERRARFRPRLPGSPEPSEAVLLAALADHRAAIDGRGVARRLRSVARALELDPDSRGPALVEDAPGAEEAEALEWLEPRPAFVAGRREGPAGLAGGLEALGRAGRARVLRGTRGAASAAGTDPAFASAFGFLLRRLVLSERFLDWAEIEGGTDLRDDLRFEEAAGIRTRWARTDLACRAVTGADPLAAEGLARACGRPASPELLAGIWDADTRDAATLRGAAFAVLLEERLRTRSGHLWFRDERSPRFCRELWEAEVGETAESVADALDLGTMDALLLFDGYRV